MAISSTVLLVEYLPFPIYTSTLDELKAAHGHRWGSRGQPAMAIEFPKCCQGPLLATTPRRRKLGPSRGENKLLSGFGGFTAAMTQPAATGVGFGH
jgi:hypothetical protein